MTLMAKPSTSAHILIVESPYYAEIAAELARGAIAELERAGASYERTAVPGAFEIPAAIAFALAAERTPAGKPGFDGFVTLGCVIRGETSHYDYICGESARKLQDLACDRGLAIGYGILTCENRDQAWVRANVNDKNKGGDAAKACLAMLALRRQLKLATSP